MKSHVTGKRPRDRAPKRCQNCSDAHRRWPTQLPQEEPWYAKRPLQWVSIAG